MEVLLATFLLGGIALVVGPSLRRESHLVRSLIVGFSLAMTARYAYWRTTSTLPVFELSFVALYAYAFYALEMTCTYLAMGDLLLLKRTTSRTAEVERNLDWYEEREPRVDILVPTYNEPWEVLEKTIVGAQAQNYSNYAIWIFDDGRRAWLEEKAKSVGVGYVTRTENSHYKAGNLNHGIAELRRRGLALEYIALLDADFIARPEFLRRTMSLMKTDDVGIVQTPQNFYNPDPYQQAFGGVRWWPDEQRSWFDVYLPSLDAIGGATCCGTSCLIRMTALDAIGGFPTDSVCEDTLTSIKMRKEKWKTVFLSERLTVGLAPEGVGEFISQRARWLVGGIQNMRYLGARPGALSLFRHKLFLYRMGLFGLMRPAWVSLPVIFSFTGVWIFQTEGLLEAMSYFGPLWLDRFFLAWLFGGRRMPVVSDAQWFLLFPMWIRETVNAMSGRAARFSVTDKAVHKVGFTIHWTLLRYHLLLAGLLVAGIVHSVLVLPKPGYEIAVNATMSAFFLSLLIAAMLPGIEFPKRRTADRYATNESVTVRLGGHPVQMHVRDISLSGVLLQTTRVDELPQEIDLEIQDIGMVRASVVRRPSTDTAALAFVAPTQRPPLIRKLYCTDQYIPHPTEWSLTDVLTAYLRKLAF